MTKQPDKRRNQMRRRSMRTADRLRIRRPHPALRDEEEMLAEFSDGTNDFYVDEVQKRRNLSRKPQSGKNKSKGEKRKPISPTRRKIIRILSYGTIISVVLVVGVILSLTVLFKTQAYEVSGVTRYAEDEIVAACGIGKGENIFLAPKRPAENRIKAEYPYVEEASVSFKIPDTIRISVVEAIEGYLVKMSDSSYLVISTKGRILNQISDVGEYDLPIFIGPTPLSGEIGNHVSYEDEKVVMMIESITQTFADNGYQGITEIDATDTADISFTYDDRIKVKLGIPEDLDYKIRTAMTIINENLDKKDTISSKGILDVSRCNSTKRSYFNEQEIHPTEPKPSEVPTQAYDDDGWSDDDWSGDGYGYDDDSYLYDDGYYDDSNNVSYADYDDDNGYGYYE